jgi:hypothetical protein
LQNLSNHEDKSPSITTYKGFEPAQKDKRGQLGPIIIIFIVILVDMASDKKDVKSAPARPPLLLFNTYFHLHSRFAGYDRRCEGKNHVAEIWNPLDHEAKRINPKQIAPH